MMKKGFTLIELLGVITLIAVLSLVTVPIVSYSINNSKTSLHNNQEKIILKAAIDWSASNTDKLPINGTDEEKVLSITLGYLKAQGYIASSIRDPETGYLYPNDLKVEIHYDDTKNYENDNSTFKYNGNYRFEILKNQELQQLELDEDIPAVSLNICGTGTDADNTNPTVLKCIKDNIDLIYDGYDVDQIDLDYYDNKKEKSNMKDYNYNNKTVSLFDMSKYGFYYVYYTKNDQTDKSDLKIFMINDLEVPKFNPKEFASKEYSVGYSGEINLLDDVNCTDNSGYCKIKTSGNVNPNIKGKYVVNYIASDNSGNTTKKKRVITVK